MQQLISRRTIQRNQLATDGRQALALLAQGKTIEDVLLLLPGSRARLYRAMAAAQQPTVADPTPAQSTKSHDRAGVDIADTHEAVMADIAEQAQQHETNRAFDPLFE